MTEFAVLQVQHQWSDAARFVFAGLLIAVATLLAFHLVFTLRSAFRPGRTALSFDYQVVPILLLEFSIGCHLLQALDYENVISLSSSGNDGVAVLGLFLHLCVAVFLFIQGRAFSITDRTRARVTRPTFLVLLSLILVESMLFGLSKSTDVVLGAFIVCDVVLAVALVMASRVLAKEKTYDTLLETDPDHYSDITLDPIATTE